MMPKGTAESFGAQYGHGSILRKGGGADRLFGIATVQCAGLGSLMEGQRLLGDVTRDKGHRFSAVNLRAVE